MMNMKSAGSRGWWKMGSAEKYCAPMSWIPGKNQPSRRMDFPGASVNKPTLLNAMTHLLTGARERQGPWSPGNEAARFSARALGATRAPSPPADAVSCRSDGTVRTKSMSRAAFFAILHHDGGPEHGMAREGQLGRGREDPDARGAAGDGRMDEHRLGEVDLARDRLKELDGNVVPVGEDGELVAGQRPIGEHVADHVAKWRHPGLPRSMSGYQADRNVRFTSAIRFSSRL